MTFATAGSDYAVQYVLMQSVVARMPRLRYVLVGMDEISLHIAALYWRKGDYRDLTDRGVPWWHLPEITWHEKMEYAVRYHPLAIAFLQRAQARLRWVESDS